MRRYVRRGLLAALVIALVMAGLAFWLLFWLLLAAGGQTNGSAAVADLAALLRLFLAVVVLPAMWLWRIFSKAGQPGWAAVIPIYNALVFLRMVGRPWWWLLLTLIPLVNLIIIVVVTRDLSKSFGKGLGYRLGELFLPFIFYPLLGFGRARYMGPAAAR